MRNNNIFRLVKDTSAHSLISIKTLFFHLKRCVLLLLHTGRTWGALFSLLFQKQPSSAVLLKVLCAITSIIILQVNFKENKNNLPVWIPLKETLFESLLVEDYLN